jgi:hypothetical protein
MIGAQRTQKKKTDYLSPRRKDAKFLRNNKSELGDFAPLRE